MSVFADIRRRFDIVPAKHRPRPVLIGFIVLAVIVVALVSAGLRHIPLTPYSGKVMSAEFAHADQVSNRTVVRMNGIEVGRVDKVVAGGNPLRTSKVEMRITNSHIKLHTDASAQIRWRTLLGGLMFIDLHPGTPSKPLLDGPIPATHTSNQVEIDQVLEAYTGDTAQQQRNLFKGLKNTFSDPRGTGKTLDTLSPTLKTIANGLGPVLGEQTDDLGKLAVAAGKTVHGLDDTLALQSLVTSADQTLAVTDARSKQLGQTLQLSPASLQSTYTTMARLRTTLGHLDPLVNKMLPGARALGPAADAAAPALGKLRTVLYQLDPLLKQAGPTFAALRTASPQGVSLMNGLDPTVTRLLNDIFPWLRKADNGTRLATYEMIGPFWSDLAMVAGEYDTVGYRIRFTVPPGSSSFISSPIATQMTSTCTHSGLQAALCSKAIGMLANGLFGPKAGGKR